MWCKNHMFHVPIGCWLCFDSFKTAESLSFSRDYFFQLFLQKWLQMTQEDWKEPLYLLKKITMKCFLTFLDVLVQNTFQLMAMPWFTLILILTYFCPQVQRFFFFYIRALCCFYLKPKDQTLHLGTLVL